MTMEIIRDLMVFFLILLSILGTRYMQKKMLKNRLLALREITKRMHSAYLEVRNSVDHPKKGKWAWARAKEARRYIVAMEHAEIYLLGRIEGRPARPTHEHRIQQLEEDAVVFLHVLDADRRLGLDEEVPCERGMF